MHRFADEAAASDSGSSDTPAAPTGIKRKRKRKLWSQDEVAALESGYTEFGDQPNVWVLIKAKHAEVLSGRTNVDLKDKYRNLRKAAKVARTEE